MNKTQKEAWFGVASALLCIAVSVYAVIQLCVIRSLPGVVGKFWPFGIWCAFAVVSIVFLRKKQSPAEVEADERDNQIKYRAVLTCFVSVWIMLAAAAAIPQMVVGEAGSIPVWLLPFMNVGILIITMLVYSIAVLVQYSWPGRGEKS